ncbi:MAG: hypothetical protein ISR65_20525 [Bacteriovoracaceae bacterium]|nr:hypothetical protein [Bacteriovoracaceae bacterium]
MAISSDKLNIGVIDLPEKIDPSELYSANEYRIAYNLLSSLFYLGPNDRYYSYLLSNWHADRDKKTLVLTLKKSLKFSNGDPLTIDDVIFSLKRQVIKGGSHNKLASKLVGGDLLKKIEQDISGIKKLNELNLELTFKSFSDVVFYIFTMPDTGILSKKQVDKNLNVTDWSFSSGPYHIKSKTEKKMILVKNKYHSLSETDFEFHFFKYDHEAKIVNDLLEGKIDYTFQKMFSKPEIYEKLENAKNIRISEGKITAVQEIDLNFTNYPFSDINFRQALYKEIMGHDLRPLKNDKYFVKADQYLFPHHIGRLSAEQVTSKMNSYKNLKKKYDVDKTFKYYSSNSLLPGSVKNFILAFLDKHGISIKEEPYQGYKHVRENWSEVSFFAAQMFMNDKELQQSIGYSVNMGWVFDKSQSKIKELNDKLFGAHDDKEKSILINKIADLIMEDSTIIPLYYMVSHDFMNKKIILNQDFGYFDTPKLWNFRYATKQ